LTLGTYLVYNTVVWLCQFLLWQKMAAQIGGNWFHVIFWRIVLEVAQIWRELVPHYFPADCFQGSSDDGLFWD
jgi:hypothetical protein